MDSIASRLFGRDAGRLLDLIAGGDGREGEAADRVERSGEWCGSTPGRGSAARQARRATRSPLSLSDLLSGGSGRLDG
jgi:hypothetical protein